MSIKQQPQIATSITLGYSDSEDRLWCRLILKDKNETRFWLTRGLCFNFCKNIWQFLNTHSPTATAAFQSFTKEQATSSAVDKSPPPPEKVQVNSGLCTNININYQNDVYTIKFLTNSQSQYILQLNSEATCRLMNAFTISSFNANWHLPVDWPHTHH